MKKRLLFLALAISGVSFAQSTDRFKNDNVFVDFGAEIWLPEDNALTSEVYSHNIGFTFYGQANKEEQVTVAYGLGFSWNNVYTNLAYQSDLATEERMSFLLNDSISYNRNKFVAAYLDIPIELRFRGKPNEDGKFFRMYVGTKVGVRIGNYTKYVTDELKIKEQRLNAASQFRIGLQGRIGYGKWALFGFLPLNTVFEDNSPYEVRSITIGLSFTP